MFVSTVQLREAVQSSQADGIVNTELTIILMRMVAAAAHTFHFSADELYAIIWLRINHVLHRIDPQRELFSYITQIIKHEGFILRRSSLHFEDRRRKLYERVRPRKFHNGFSID